MAVTIKEIAEYANVSRGTVDRALHGRGGIRPEVEKRIRAIADSMGYKPNSAAKALSNLKKKLNIGLLLPSIHNPFFADLIQGAQEAQRALADHGVELLLVEMRGYDIEEQVRRIDWLVSQKIDMLVLTPFDDSRIAEKINELTKQGIEVLTVNSDICNSDRVCYVGIDFERSGHIAAGLLGLINRRANVLIVNGSPKLMSHGQRVRGFMDTIQTRFPEVRLVATVVCNDDNFAAYDLVRQKLQDYPEIDMVYIVGEGITGVCAAISEFTFHQIDVICFDDVPHTKELFEEGKISATICQQPHQQGYLVVQQCYNRFIGSAPRENAVIELENQIKIRESLY